MAATRNRDRTGGRSGQRRWMVDRDIAARGVRDQRVLDAVAEVPREWFVPASVAHLAYDDAPLPIGEGQTISQPYIVAYMAEAAELGPEARVLEVGTGSGYAAAVFSRIARRVYTVERHGSLAAQAEGRFRELGYDNIEVAVRDGTLGWPEHAPYDAIIVAAAGPERIPPALLEQLARGGRLVIPRGADQMGQDLVRIRRSADGLRFDEENLAAVRFVPLIGEAGWRLNGTVADEREEIDRTVEAARIMEAHALRTGVTSQEAPRRYLWTDAFAVCNCLALYRHSGSPFWLERARRLIDQVHRVLGRHRPDDARTGWISGLPDAEGARHPTAGGLRIGKPRPERGSSDAPHAQLDWERDGQYYHYLTRWQHALVRAFDETGDPELLRHAVELAQATHAAFAHGVAGERRLYWKMSVDLSEPVVASMGQHDALDGLVVTARLQQRLERSNGGVDLRTELGELAAMCHGRDWATTDALGIGSLLVDGWFLAQVTGQIPGDATQLLTRVLRDAARSLRLVTTGRYLDAPAGERLAFRELGLSIGLAAVDRLHRLADAGGLPPDAAAEVQRLLPGLPLRQRIESFWTEPAHQAVPGWAEHEDINAVMLATSLLPDGYLGGPTGTIT